jgi:hypothetical protein
VELEVVESEVVELELYDGLGVDAGRGVRSRGVGVVRWAGCRCRSWNWKSGCWSCTMSWVLMQIVMLILDAILEFVKV